MAPERKRLLQGVAAVLLAAAVLYAGYLWLLQQIVREPYYSAERGYQGAALYNPFYAAGRLLGELGLEVRSRRRVPAPAELGAADVLLLNAPTHTLSEATVDRLFDWVGGGGHLIVSASRAYDFQADAQLADALFDALGLSVRTVETETGFGADNAAPVEVTLQGLAEPLRVKFNSRFELADEAAYAVRRIEARGRVHALQYEYGDGLISVFDSLDFIANERLGEFDHADFLWHGLHELHQPAVVWLQYSPLVPSLLELLWRHAWTVLLGFLLTLAAVIWASAQRLGPVLLVPQQA